MIQTINAGLPLAGKSANINFKTRYDHSSAVVQERDFEVVVPDLLKSKFFTIANSVSGDKGQNPGFAIKTGLDGTNKNYEVFVNSSNTPSVKLSKQLGANIPEAKFKVGKFGPTIELIDREIGIKVQLLTGSKATCGDKLSVDVIDPKAAKPAKAKNISFKGGGKLQVVTYHAEDSTKEAVEGYMGAGLNKAVEKGDFFDALQSQKPNIMVLAGGYGTRLYNITGDSGKPALRLPTNPNYRLMSNALDSAAKSGFGADSVEYISGKGSIKGDNVRNVIQQTNLGDGGCIAKSLYQNDTPTDAPLVILNADTFTNADITRAYKAFLDHPDAAILIPFYEATEERAKGFGLMAADTSVPSADGVYEIQKFVEKPKNPQVDAKGAKVVGKDDKFMANPGIYIIGPKALEALKAEGKDINSEFGLAKKFITRIVAECQRGEFLDASGNPMKCYTTKLEKKGGGAAYWDDLGTDVTITKTFQDMAAETKAKGIHNPDNKFYGMPDFLLRDAMLNADTETGRVYMNKEAREKYEMFCKKYPGFEATGNVIVYDSIA